MHFLHILVLMLSQPPPPPQTVEGRVESGWPVLTLLKIHVSKSHVSCLSHIYLEEWGWKEKCVCGGWGEGGTQTS